MRRSLRFDEVCQIIALVSSALTGDPRRFSFENTSTGLPLVVPHSGIDANKWPSPEKMQEVLSDCHRAAMDLNTAWDRVPDRTGLQPPEDPWRTNVRARR
jgi:hypothetical protein